MVEGGEQLADDLAPGLRSVDKPGVEFGAFAQPRPHQLVLGGVMGGRHRRVISRAWVQITPRCVRSPGENGAHHARQERELASEGTVHDDHVVGLAARGGGGGHDGFPSGWYGVGQGRRAVATRANPGRW